MRITTIILSLYISFTIANASQSDAPQDSIVTQQLDSLLGIYKQNLDKNPAEAQKSVRELITLSSKYDKKLYKARGHYFLAYLLNAEGKNEKAIEQGLLSAKALKDAGREKGLSAVYNVLAVAYRNLGDNIQAMDYYVKCLEMAELEGDQTEIGHVYGNIANIYIEQEKYESAIDNLQRASEAYKAANYPDGVVSTLFALANIFKNQGKNEAARSFYRKVIEYSLATENLAQEANARINLGQLLLAEKKYKEALPMLQKTYALLQKLGYPQDQVIVLNDLGVACKNLNQTQEAIGFYKQALQIKEGSQLHDAIHLNLSGLYADNKQYKMAFQHLSQAYSLKDSLNSLEKDKHLAELQQQYETQLKETQITVLEQEKSLKEAQLSQSQSEIKRQTLLRNAFIIGFALVLLSLVLLRHSYIKRMRIQKQLSIQKEEIARQKINTLIKDYRLDAIKKYNEGQQEERKRIAREIHDGLASDLASLKISFEHFMSKQMKDKGLQKMLYTIQTLYKDLRGISHQLHPPAFSESGFSDFLQQFLLEKSKETETTLEALFFPQNEIDQLPDNILAEIYRIAQELTTNMLKHAEATEGEVQITKHEDYINVVVSDNGRGMPSQKVSGIGLRNIKERLEYLEGALDIDTGKRGTTININLPLHHS